MQSTEGAIRATVAHNIALARRDAEMTQAELAGLCGVRAQLISRWERGESAPALGNLAMLCEALEKVPAFFFEDRPDASGI